jgi:hypothetical protein
MSQKNILWFGPCGNVIVNGINITPLVFNFPEDVKINGINIEGIGLPLLLYMIPHTPYIMNESVVIENKFRINGLTVAPVGLVHSGTVNGLAATIPYTSIEQVNGIVIASMFNISKRINGICISIFNSTVELNGLQIGFSNEARCTKGVQIGLYNRSDKLNGLQIGFWNVNGKRKLPIINW